MITVFAFILLTVLVPDHSGWLYVLTVLTDLSIVDRIARVYSGKDDDETH